MSLSYDAVVALPLSDLKQQLGDGNSQSRRELRAYLGLGSGGTKEENRCLIYDHIERQRHLLAGLQPPYATANATDAVLIEVISDPLTKSDPGKGKKDKANPDIGKDRKNDIKKPMFEKSRGNLH